MKKLIILIVICIIISIPDLGVCQYWTYNINVDFGIKKLDKDDWKPVDNQIEYGVLLDFKQKTWPVNIAVDILNSKDDGTRYYPDLGYKTNYVGKTLELDLGLRKIWALKTFRPFIGGGAAFVAAKYERNYEFGYTARDDDYAIGAWINGGLYWTIKKFNIGFDLRWSKANIEFSPIELSPKKLKMDAGGIHYGLILGYHY